MFIVKCLECVREQEWKTGADVSEVSIQVAGSIVRCDCGSYMEEHDGMLYEGKYEE